MVVLGWERWCFSVWVVLSWERWCSRCLGGSGLGKVLFEVFGWFWVGRGVFQVVVGGCGLEQVLLQCWGGSVSGKVVVSVFGLFRLGEVVFQVVFGWF